MIFSVCGKFTARCGDLFDSHTKVVIVKCELWSGLYHKVVNLLSNSECRQMLNAIPCSFRFEDLKGSNHIGHIKNWNRHKMPTHRDRLKCAEIYWVQDDGTIEYECTGCCIIFGSHNLCMLHLKECPFIVPSQEVQIKDELSNGRHDIVVAKSVQSKSMPVTIVPDKGNQTITDVDEDNHADVLLYIERDDVEKSFKIETQDYLEANSPLETNPLHVEDTLCKKDEDDVSLKQAEVLLQIELIHDSNVSSIDESINHVPKSPLVEDIDKEAYQFTKLLLSRLQQDAPKYYLLCDICGHHAETRSRILFHMFRVHIRQGPRKTIRKFGDPGTTDAFRDIPKSAKQAFVKPKCDKCGRLFPSLAKMNIHRHYFHSNGSSFPCRSCLMVFDTEEERKTHTYDTHLNRIYTCDVCGIFSSRFSSNFADHMRTHTGERPFVCDIGDCQKACTTKSTLNAHKKHCHNDEKPYVCHVCLTASFKTQSRLTSHIRCRHLKKFSSTCSVCSKGFSTKAQLLTHSYSHTGERPFECTICNKRFAERQSLRHHVNRHTNTLPYQCRHDDCDRLFPSTSGRYFHERSVHKMTTILKTDN